MTLKNVFTKEQKQFCLMQHPSVPDPSNHYVQYYSIGLASKYRDKGFNFCDKYGNKVDSFPNKPTQHSQGWFAFMDEPSIKAFKGDKQVINGITFGMVKYSPPPKEL